MNDIEKNQNDVGDFTKEEIKKLCDGGFIPPELLEPSKLEELKHYLKFNRENLLEHCYPNYDKFPVMVRIPPQNELYNAPDLQVIDRRTGQVVQILEMGASFQLCEGVSLQIKAKELQDWEKETAEARQLDKEQNKILIATIQQIGSERPLTRKDIVKIIEEVRKPQKNKTFRQSRELIDNKLDRSLEKGQLTFFDILERKDKLIDDIQTNVPIIKGLDLDQAEDRILQTLSLLLHEKSENKNQESPNYYMGNYGKGIISVNQVEMETARMAVSPHELYSKYYGKDSYGSDQIKFLLNKLDVLSKKMFLTSWKFPTGKKNKKGQLTFNLFRTNLPLFQMALLNEELSEVACNEIMTNELILEGKRCKFLFKFQPQFTNHIKTQYVEFPEDVHLRIAAATGKDRYGQYINLMRDFLFREKQHKRYDIIRDKSTIIETLKLDKFWKEGRKKLVNEKIQECVDVFMKIELIITWNTTQGKQGQDQYHIKINHNFK
jgi:hypothetical protein